MPFFKRFRKPKSSVSLTVPKTTFELGENLKGAITVSCKEEFDATEVRAELRCIEKKETERWVYDSREKRNVRRTYTDKNTHARASETIKLRVIRPATAPAAVKEKEVAMVPCEYCETLMPETATSCPNCGAPRKA